MAFVVPCLAIIVCYARIFYIVRKTAMRSHEPLLQPRLNPNSMATSVPSILNNVTKNNNVGSANLQPKNEAKKSLLEQPIAAPSDKKHRACEVDGHSGSSEQSSSTVTCQNNLMSQYEPRLMLKFIDSSVDSELPPYYANMSHSADTIDKNESAERRKLSSVSMGRNVEFREDVNGGLNGEAEGDGELSASLNLSQYSASHGNTRSSNRTRRFRKDTDSAVEESTSSSENNQV